MLLFASEESCPPARGNIKFSVDDLKNQVCSFHELIIFHETTTRKMTFLEVDAGRDPEILDLPMTFQISHEGHSPGRA